MTAVFVPAAHAQTSGPVLEAATNIGEIIVTARKRNETLMTAPVAVQAFTSEKLEKLAINDIAAFSAIAPNLTIHYATGGVGAVAFLRGIGNGEAASFIDQSVLLNVDDVPQTHGAFMKSGLFDAEQIEVLKGPQALFFGKSASAGIISVRTADPTAEWTSSLKGSYGFTADEARTEGYIAGPLGGGFGVRVAGYYDHLDGYLHNPALSTTEPRVPHGKDYGGRITVKYDGGPTFNARLKWAQTQVSQLGNTSFSNQVRCAGATPQKPTQLGDDCRLNSRIRPLPDSKPYRPDLDFGFGSPNFQVGSPSHLSRNGRPYQQAGTSEGALQLNYTPTPALTFTSVTGFNRVATQDGGRAPVGPQAGGFADVYGTFIKRDISQELRVASNFTDSKINFLAGVFVARSRSYYETYLALPTFTLYTNDTIRYFNNTESAFGQILYNPIKEVEISGGLRYTKVREGLKSLFNKDNYPDGVDGEQLGRVPAQLRRFTEDNLSPEVTIKYQVTPDFMAYASGKFGYKGPGYNVSTIAPDFGPPSENSPFKGEKVRGVEGGVKATLFHDLQVSSTAYYYKYIGLQVSFVDNTTFAFNTNNGADAEVYGLEGEFTYRPATITGLTLNGFVNYNHGKYLKFPAATCYGGQTVAQGCRIDPVLGPVQDLGGQRLQRAPYWAGLVGVDYRREVGENLVAGLTFNSNFSSNYYVSPEKNPVSFQSSWITFDGSVSLRSRSGSWEVALIGRNLTNKFYMTSGVDDYSSALGVPADVLAYSNTPREVLLQVTLRPHW